MGIGMPRARIVSNQPRYNMLWRVIEPEVLPLYEKEGIGQVVFQPLAQGVPPPAGSRAASGGRAPVFIRRVLGDELLRRVQGLRPVAEAAGLSMAQLAIAWTLQRPGVSTAIIGASRPEQVAENAAAAGVRLDPDAMSRIDDLLADLIDTDATETGKMVAVKPNWVRADATP
jgi:aryl-alcohol dehydrogenase-like predicted oxidoreductase